MNTTVVPFKNHSQRTNQNELITKSAIAAVKTIKTLAKHGYTILNCVISEHRPVIWIQSCKHCERLKGAWYTKASGANATVYTMQAKFDEAIIKWQADTPPGAVS